MAGSFESSEDQSGFHYRPLHVATRKSDIYGEVLDMVNDLDAWELVSKDSDQLLVTARRGRGFLGGTATITIRVEGPDDVPKSTVTLRSESTGGLMSRDKANVFEFMKLFHRRVC